MKHLSAIVSTEVVGVEDYHLWGCDTVLCYLRSWYLHSHSYKMCFVTTVP
jgi:hypothetical protein